LSLNYVLVIDNMRLKAKWLYLVTNYLYNDSWTAQRIQGHSFHVSENGENMKDVKETKI